MIVLNTDVKNFSGTTGIQTGLDASKPSAGLLGRYYFAVDTDIIYYDNGTTWEVFINSATATGFVTIGTTQTITGVKTFNAGTTFNNNVYLKDAPNLILGGTGLVAIEPQINLYDQTASMNWNLKVGSTPLFNLIFSKVVSSVTTALTTLDISGNLATIGGLKIGTAPGNTYKVEIDGGLNIATGHEYRKNGVDIFNTTNNTIPKFNSTTKVLTDSSIVDDATKVAISIPTFINTATDNNTGAKLQVTGGISFQNQFNRRTASYTLVLTDQNKVVEMNVATANNLTVPTNASVAFPIGTEIAITQYGAGKTTVVASSGVTIRSAGALLSISAQYAMATLLKVGNNEWYLVGSLIA